MNKIIGFGIGGSVVGLVAGLLIAKTGTPNPEPPLTHSTTSEQISMMPEMNMQKLMQDMTTNLSGKTGSEFDKAFITEMTMHHQGAIEMAQAALKNSERQEIKDLARNIISAQTAEINQMKTWQKEWFNQ